jgi:hypothetical protein
MKAIELTKEHRGKLLEMCKELFPEYYKRVKYRGNNEDYFADESCRPQFKIHIYGEYLNFPSFEDNDSEPLEYNVQFTGIHWFEFCMTHLLERIFNPGNPHGLVPRTLIEKLSEFFRLTNFYFWNVNFGNEDTDYENHPVDYLYKEFKKIKL